MADEPSVSCERALVARRYAEVLSGRSLTQPQRDRMYAALAARARSDLPGLKAALDRSEAYLAGFAGLAPAEQATRRSAHIYGLANGGGVFPQTAWPEISSVIDASIAIWTRDEASGLVLTEMDIEGWIHYASLAREVQGGTPLRVSMADRVTVYRLVREAWASYARADKLAMLSVGPFWPQVRVRWKMASYTKQQAWIRAAPLPPPMTSTSIGYLEALTDERIGQHAQVLHRTLGPFDLGEGW